MYNVFIIAKDQRLCTLDHIEKYSTHSTILLKMHNSQIIRKNEILSFENSLMPHQKAVIYKYNNDNI